MYKHPAHAVPLFLAATCLATTAPRLRAAPPVATVQRPKTAPAPTAQQKKNAAVTRALVRLIRSKVSTPGGSMTLKVVPAPRADKGYFSEIIASGRPAQIKKLRMTELSLHARNVRINVHDLYMNRQLHTISSQTKMRAVISESDLTGLLARGRTTGPMGLRVKFVGDRLHVTGNFSWGWFSGPVAGVGKMRLGAGHKVFLDILSLKLNGSEVPAWLKTKFSDKINPVIDYADIPFKPALKSLTFKGNLAILTA